MPRSEIGLGALEKKTFPPFPHVNSSLEALSLKVSFLKRHPNDRDYRSLFLPSVYISGNVDQSHHRQPSYPIGIATQTTKKNAGLYVLLVFVCVAIALGICLNFIDIQHKSMPIPNLTPNLPPNAIPNPVPPRETFTPSEYRANWTNSNVNIPSLEFETVGPLDRRNGRGLGWTVVFIHGLGAVNASDVNQWREFLLSSYTDPRQGASFGNLTGLNFIFPKAPIKNITVYDTQKNHGERPGWFDIKDWRDLHYLEDEEGLRQSVIGLSSILRNQTLAGTIQMNQTIIAGFSQGAVMTILLTLALPQPPAASIVLSGYLPLPLRLVDLRSTSPTQYKRTSLYWLHGIDDQLLTINQAQAGMKLLGGLFSDRFLRAKFKSLPNLGHGFNLEERKIVSNYIDGMVSRNTSGFFDSQYDAVVQPENEGDIIQFSAP